WYYNQRATECRPFVYSGCQGNPNRFQSKEECELHCGQHPGAAEPCRLPLDEGHCQRYTLRWYYNQRATECRPFVYSGCQGNPNRFQSKEECELHC
ncbi:KCP protein, partial [Emberiza fucata]|nr:KCP protein [Emberiza fucata]